MNKEQLKERTKLFALRILKLVNALPKNTAGIVIGNQIMRSGTSVGANYRAACRSRSMADFISKLGVVIEEADETAFWLELIMEGGLIKKALVDPLFKEANEIIAIMVKSRKSAVNNHKNKSKI